MALSAKSLIVWGLEVNITNRSLDFKTTSGGPTLQATLNLGYYSLTNLAAEIVRALSAADGSHTFTCTIDRSISGGLQNRITIATNSAFFQLLFLTGSRNASSCDSLIGFTHTDKTGATTYTGTSTAGTAILTEYPGYNYLSPDFNRKVFGSVNVSASGKKEAIVFQIQKFLQVEFRFETKANVIAKWVPFLTWAIQQRPFEITPEYTVYNTLYNVTLESTAGESKGLGYILNEMLPQFPNNYRTGLIKFRVIE
jgi:hypothetical protein